MENKQELRKAIRLPGMIAMAAGGMIAAWMVEIPANGSETLRYKVRLKKQGR